MVDGIIAMFKVAWALLALYVVHRQHNVAVMHERGQTDMLTFAGTRGS